MNAPYFHMLAHIYLAVEAAEEDSSLAGALQKAGFGSSKLDSGHKLFEAGEELIDRKAHEAGTDRIYEHNLHGSGEEVEMWKSTAAFQLKKALEDEGLVEEALGKRLHAHNHTVTIVAQALRLIGMVRTHPTIHEKLGSGRSVKDLLVRGLVLLSTLFKNGDILMSPGSAGDPDHAIFKEVAEHKQRMFDWLAELGVAAQKMSGQPELLGILGYVPEDVGIPLGGTAYGVPLHEKAQRDDLPEFDNLRPDPGWSAGRQGRNRENLGGGWVEPKFE